MVVGGKFFDMMQFIFPQNEKKDVIVVLITIPEKLQESSERNLEIHVPWCEERNVKHYFPRTNDKKYFKVIGKLEMCKGSGSL